MGPETTARALAPIDATSYKQLHNYTSAKARDGGAKRPWCEEKAQPLFWLGQDGHGIHLFWGVDWNIHFNLFFYL